MNHWYFRIMWNGRDGGHTKEPAPPPCKGWSSSKRREVALVVDRAGAQTWRVSVSPKDGWRMRRMRGQTPILMPENGQPRVGVTEL